MLYAFLIYETPEEFEARRSAWDGPYWSSWSAYSKALGDAGLARGGAALKPPAAGEVLRAPDGARTIQDGPFADTKEQLGGFFLIDAPDLDAALDWAARAPNAAKGAVEVRPIQVFDEAGEGDGAPEAAGEPAKPTHAFLIYDDERMLQMAPEEMDAEMGRWFAYTEALRMSEVMVAGEALQPAATATTVRLRDGTRHVADGPYADSKERLGGFYLIREGDPSALRDWAEKCPAAGSGAIEIRPAMAMEG